MLFDLRGKEVGYVDTEHCGDGDSGIHPREMTPGLNRTNQLTTHPGASSEFYLRQSSSLTKLSQRRC